MLISDDYRAQQTKLHENPNYGVASVQFAPLVSQIIEQTGARTLLDYGAGKCRLMHNVEVSHDVAFTCYDPAIPELSERPKGQFDLVCCIDVLEHIEPEFLPGVLNELEAATGSYAFLTVHTGPAVKVLADGRNAHLIQKPPSWWLPQIMERFELMTFQSLPNGFFVVCHGY